MSKSYVKEWKENKMVKIYETELEASADSDFIENVKSEHVLPGITNYGKVDETGIKKYWLCMEKADYTLRSYTERLSRKDVMLKFPDIFKQLIIGLNDIHSSGFVHRDIKSDNIVVFIDSEKKETYKYIDFCMSSRIDESGLLFYEDGIMYKDECYVEDVTKTDICLLGLTMGIMLTTPSSVERVRNTLRSIDHTYVNIITRMIDPDPYKRPSVGDILRLFKN